MGKPMTGAMAFAIAGAIAEGTGASDGQATTKGSLVAFVLSYGSSHSSKLALGTCARLG
jgi:hypothetical protein